MPALPRLLARPLEKRLLPLLRRLRCAARAEMAYARRGRKTPVTVIMTCHNAGPWVEAAIDSIRRQSHKNLEIIVVDDASTDDSLQKIMARQKADPRIRVFAARRNVGPYVCKNHALTQSRHDMVTFQDADDIAARRRLARQLGVMAGAVDLRACLCLRQYCDGGMRPVTVNGKREGQALISLMFRKSDILPVAGYFDSVAFAADSEYRDRIEAIWGAGSVSVLPLALYKARQHSRSITHGGDGRHDWTYGDRRMTRGAVHPARRAYHENYARWHDDRRRDGTVPFMPFPAAADEVARPFALPEGMGGRVTGGNAGMEGLFAEIAPVAADDSGF